MKITFCCLPGLTSVLEPTTQWIMQNTEHQIRRCYEIDKEMLIENIQWADIVWLEWANEMAVAITQKMPQMLFGKKVVCRLRSYEVLHGYVPKINWQPVTDIVFVADHVKDAMQSIFRPVYDDIPNKHVIHNGIKLDDWVFKDKPQGQNLAFLALLNHKKGLGLLLQAFSVLHKLNDKYQLFIGGPWQEERLRFYIPHLIREMRLTGSVHFDGEIPKSDVNAWLQDKHYIVSASPWEGHPMNVMEGMVCGLKPIIHNWPGAKRLFPAEYVWTTITEFTAKVVNKHYNPKAYRDYIAKHFAFEQQMQATLALLEGEDG